MYNVHIIAIIINILNITLYSNTYIIIIMNIVKNIEQYNEDYVYFCEPIKNNIMNNGQFIRIIYSAPLFALNGIYLYLYIDPIAIEKYYNKYKYMFDIALHKHIIEHIRVIEETILDKIRIKNKMPQCKIYEQLKQGNIKIFSNNIEKKNNAIVLKIAGIWETNNEYGLTYKFIK